MDFIIALIIALILGRKRPLVSSILGCVVIVALYFILKRFNFIGFMDSVWQGCLSSFLFSYVMYFIWSGVKGGNHNTGPSFWGLGRGSAPQGNNIVLTDEEKNRRKK